MVTEQGIASWVRYPESTACRTLTGRMKVSPDYDDGGFTGANADRPALQRLLTEIQARKIDVVVVHRVDRLSRSLLDFAKMMEIFDAHRVAFASVTQELNTATSMGRRQQELEPFQRL